MRSLAFATRNYKEILRDLLSLLFGIGLSFLSLFLGLLMVNDRSSSFLARLFSSPLTAFDYISGYSLPLLPIAILQSLVCFATAFIFGLPVSMNALLAIIVLIPVAGLFISIGLLIGTRVFKVKMKG